MKFASSQNEHYRDGITHASIYHIRICVLDGINNKIKDLKSVAYGYRDLDYFFLRIRSAFSGKFTPISTIGYKKALNELCYIQIRAFHRF
jgi:hypothetical protein